MKTAELKAAFKRSRIWTQGYTFSEAMQQPAIRMALEATARHRCQQQQKQDQRAPYQPELIQEAV